MELVKDGKYIWSIAMIDLKPSDKAAISQCQQMLGTGWEPFGIAWKQDSSVMLDQDLKNGFYSIGLRKLERLDEPTLTST